MSNLAPYRNAAEIEKYPPPVKCGLIIKPIPPKEPTPHVCKLPRPTPNIFFFISKLLNKFGINTLKVGDLWRCECGKVYAFRRYSIDNDIYNGHRVDCQHGCSAYCNYWVKVHISYWVQAGGEE